jgi:hypothetical protein
LYNPELGKEKKIINLEDQLKRESQESLTLHRLEVACKFSGVLLKNKNPL